MFKVKKIKRKFLYLFSIIFFFLASKKLFILRNLAHVLLFLEIWKNQVFKLQFYICLKLKCKVLLKKTRFATISANNVGLGRYFKRDKYKFIFISVYVTLCSVKTNILDLSGSARNICTNKQIQRHNCKSYL